ncbi:MAG TPA: ABC transporter permease [Allosphingosinicella sp.]|jgi:lipopolysaccharide transport system permease protein
MEPSPDASKAQAVVYSGRPELADPRRFLRSAGRDLVRAPRMAWRLFAGSLRARRRRSILGHAWIIMPAAATALICVYLKAQGAFGVAPTALPYPVHVLAGMVLWQTVIEALNAPVQQLAASRQLITRSRIPHEAVMLGGLYEVGLNAAIRLVALAIVLALAGIVPAPSAVLLPVGMVALACLGTAFGLLVAPWALLYDDVRQGLALVTTFWFLLTPVVYPEVSGSALNLNPVTPLLATARSSLLGWDVHGGSLAVLAISMVLLVAGWLLYRLVQPHVVERLA